MKDQEENPIVENRMSCLHILLILIFILGTLIFGCIKMCN